MRFVTLKGKVVSKNLTKKTVDWDKPTRSKFQTSVKNFLRPYWEHHIVYEEIPVVGSSRLSLDIFNATKRVALEIQGRQHMQYIPFFHQTRQDFRKQLERDDIKETWCKLNNIILVEIHPEDLPLSESWFYKNYNIVL
jgi:hypothetical protein